MAQAILVRVGFWVLPLSLLINQPNIFCRFAMASASLWDMVSLEEAQTLLSQLLWYGNYESNGRVTLVALRKTCRRANRVLSGEFAEETARIVFEEAADEFYRGSLRVYYRPSEQTIRFGREHSDVESASVSS